MVAVAGDELVQKLASVISKLVQANRENEVLREENKQLRRKIEDLEAGAIADLECEIKELNLALMDKQREIEELKKCEEEEDDEMIKALEDLDVENKELRTHIGHMNDIEDELEDLREEHNRLIEEYNSLIEQCKPDEGSRTSSKRSPDEKNNCSPTCSMKRPRGKRHRKSFRPSPRSTRP
ncbi:hypothetical protein L596_015907 [Steinernema carpocapsae]|uniref:Uncharacterized protein n=1 Tax=Steinernema carpocapsae TaxID=34508 RepID=A0A4U5NH73_STECR|nr:hypothetical protein L596_015907 [Steinernema carpocapsae]